MKTRPSDRLLAELGIDVAASPTEEIELSSPAMVARGLVASSAVEAARAFDSAPARELALASLGGRARVQSSLVDSSLLRVETRSTITRRRGDVTEQSTGLWLINATQAGAGLVFDGEVGLLVEAGRVFVFPTASGAPRLEPLELEADILPRASLEELLHGCAVQGWLTAAVRAHLETASPYLRAAGVGLLGRFWTLPRETEGAIRALSGPNPMRAARSWYRSLAAPARAVIETEALSDAAGLARELESISSLLEDPCTLEAAAHTAALRRDDLHSLVFLARPDLRSPALDELLGAIDESAATWNSLWPSLSLPPDARLAAVSEEEPELWWGQLAPGS